MRHRNAKTAVLLCVILIEQLAAGSARHVIAGSKERPNIVLIIADDMGYGDLGINGNPLIRTPHLDAMATRSAQMTNFYVSPVCAPTRACLMTGRYNYRTRCIDTYIGRAMMDPAEVTVAKLLSDAGYATGVFGKWHLGDNYPMRPHEQGFEVALVHRGGGIGQPSDPPGGEGKYTDPILFRNGRPEQQAGYCTDVYYSNALRFIEQSHERQRPFFVYLPDNCPHGPFHDVPREDYESYRSVDLSNEKFPQHTGHPLPSQTDTDRRARIYAMVTNIDRNVGRLMRRLEDLQISRNTLVIFMVDNGPNGRRYVAGMKGMKSHVHEGGIRSPFFLQWPVRLRAGTSSDRIAAHIDVLPTLLEAAGIDPQADLRLDGRSLLPLLEGRHVDWPEREIVIQSHRGDVPTRYHHFMIRNQTWKLVHPSGFSQKSFDGVPVFELYNMTHDPLELHDLAAEHPGVVRQLKAKYDNWFDDVSSTRPDNYAPPRIHIGTPQENPTVLTRQDWRHTHGKPWRRDSRGHWLLFAASNATCNLLCRFSADNQAAGSITLRVNDQTTILPLAIGAATVRFHEVALLKGNVHLEVTLEHKGKLRGVHQIEVHCNTG